MSKEKQTVRATVFWSNMKNRNDLSGKYQVDLGCLSDKAVEALSEMGIEAKTKDDKPEMGYHITCKSNNPMRAYHPDGEEVIEDIGNGSKVTVVLGYYDWTFNSKKGRSPSMLKMQVNDLEVYEEIDDVDVDEEAAL